MVWCGRVLGCVLLAAVTSFSVDLYITGSQSRVQGSETPVIWRLKVKHAGL